jgi:hypothetical protein
MNHKQYETIDELKNELSNSELKEAIEILENELNKSEQAIKEGFEKRD